jgi:ATP adenylyltransferase
MSGRPLWAPWRLEYIKGPKPRECIFCAAAAGAQDQAELVVERGERCLAMLNAFPYANGHVMVFPVRHAASIDRLESAELLELMTLSARVVTALRRAFAPDGFNLGINDGKVAGAGFDQHVHQHVVPRWQGDTNFMPVIGSTRVLPQSLRDARAAIAAALAES